MGKITYVATPIGEINSPQWRNLMQLPSGDSIVVVGLQLRDLAASLGTGGRLVHPDGTPMDLFDFSRVLGRSVEMLQLALAALQRVGVVTLRSVTWSVTDPVTVAHFSRVKSLAIPDKKERNRQLTRERVRRYRSSKQAASNVNVTQIERYMHRYNTVQIPDFTSESSVTINNNNKHKDNKTTTFPRDYQEQINQIPPVVLSSTLKGLIQKFCEDHGAEYVVSNIRYALKNHKPENHPGRLGGMIRRALEIDYAKDERAVVMAKTRRRETAAAKRCQQELVEAEQKERNQQELLEIEQWYHSADECTQALIRKRAQQLMKNIGASTDDLLEQTILVVAREHLMSESVYPV